MPLQLSRCQVHLQHEGTATELSRCMTVTCAADVMYINEAVPDLVKTLEDLSSRETDIYIAHGRNRSAEEHFIAALSSFHVTEVPEAQLHPDYRAPDVTVFHLRRQK